MIFAAGYQILESEELFSEILRDYRPQIGEVYFSWPGESSGRPRKNTDNPVEAIEQLEYELEAMRRDGIQLDLLFNANCYGEQAISHALQEKITNLLRHLDNRQLLPDIITTTSLFIAQVVRKFNPAIDIRASVNMRIDSTLAMEYLIRDFDSFYMRRDIQRDLEQVRLFSDWCHTHEKKLCLLVNSGCMRNCPAQIFHDNLVAHDEGIAQTIPEPGFIPHLCRRHYRNKANWADYLRSSWLRPESIQAYAPYVDVCKLATRQHEHPRTVLAAYTSGHYDGDIMALTEPGFTGEWSPWTLDNRSLDGVTLPAACATNCTHCGHCEEILQKALKKLEA